MGFCLSSCKGDEPDTPSVVTPGTPTGLKLHSSSETSLAFQWDAMEGASGYVWTLTKSGATVKEGKTSSRNATISDLEKGTKYLFSVASTAEGYTSGKATLEASTEGSQEPDPTPSVDKYEEFSIPSVEEDNIARAFPGAEGGGMYTTGGRGGKVYHVTNLNDSGEGSLRWAVSQSGARTIVFDVAGVIELASDLKITKGDLTIAGQTAPGDGICLKNYTVNIAADNVIIRFMRFRLGDEAPWSEADIANGKADGEDCIWGRYHDNIILDHCSMSWSVDECASFYANENFTLQWCIIGESMKNCKLHTKGNHGYGGIWGGKNASFHHNILAHNDSRNARIDHPHIYEDHKNPSRRGNVDLRNNIIYNWGDNSTYGGEGGWFNIVNNYYKKGPSSKDRHYILDLYGVYSKCSTCGEENIKDGYPSVYVAGNKYDANADYSNTIYWHNGSGHTNYNAPLSAALAITGKDSKAAYTTTHTADAALEAVTGYAGASLKRDKVDERIASDVINGTGKIISDISEVKSAYGYAWPEYTSTSSEESRIKDTDRDGMPDSFEDEFGLDKSSADDGAKISLDKNGRYTNLEMYLHYLVKDIIASGNATGSYNKL